MSLLVQALFAEEMSALHEEIAMLRHCLNGRDETYRAALARVAALEAENRKLRAEVADPYHALRY